MSPSDDLDDLSSAQLRELVASLFAKLTKLEWTIVEQRAEIARLKGLKGPPTIKPSGMDKATEPTKSGSPEKRPGRGKVQPRVSVEDRVLKVAVPAEARFKGYEAYLVQELVLSARAIRYLRERWVTANGQAIIAPLPAGMEGHFGPELRRFVLMLYHQGQSTLPRLTALLQSVGVSISQREVQRLLTETHDGFLVEAREVLRAGLATSAWISVDDTGARHKVTNGFCTQIGNDRFTWFGTRPSKNRLNFLDLLRAVHTDFVLNEATRALPASLIAHLAAQLETAFTDQAAWQAHLGRLGFSALTTTPDPAQIATEGAIWGSIYGHDFLRVAVVLGDDAGQFAVGRHALCWVHAERLVHQLDACTDRDRAAQQQVRKLIWNFYAALKAYRTNSDNSRRLALRARFDRIFRRRTGFVTLDRLLARWHANKAELLVVFDRPQTPLHTNGSENDIRYQVTRPAEPAATLAATAATPSSASPRPATSSAWHSGTISAAASRSPASPSFRSCRTSSAAAASPPGTTTRPGFCRYYVLARSESRTSQLAERDSHQIA